MLQNATDLDLTAFVGVGLGAGSWEAFCKNSIISRQIVETTAKDFAGTNPRYETVILEFAFYEYSGRFVYHLLKQNGFRRGSTPVSTVLRKSVRFFTINIFNDKISIIELCRK